VRENHGGILYTQAYGKSISQGIDPVEKKPLYHFYPGSKAISIATAGCNFHCRFCQNWQISQVLREGGSIFGEELPPDKIVALACESGCQSIAYTYTEPTIFFEYAHDTARLAHQAGLNNIFVTNGYMTREALQVIRPYLEAANVDLKSFDDAFYRKWVGAKLQPVLDTLKLMKELNIWLEVTTLVIPTLSDSEDNLRQIASFIAQELGVSTPWHVSRFYPAYELEHLPQTPIEALRKAREIGLQAGLRYVYEGNVPGSDGNGTFCYNCGHLLVRRSGHVISEYRIQAGHCYNCGAEVDGIGM
jgi:pyruvate formate lyase activating enzyme